MIRLAAANKYQDSPSDPRLLVPLPPPTQTAHRSAIILLSVCYYFDILL